LLIVTDIVFIACTFANNTLQLLVDTSDSSNTEKPRDFVKDWGMPDKATIDTARRGVQLFKKTISPIFMSTLKDGTIVRGLSALPDKDPSRPLLLIGNHQFLTIDISLVVEALLTEKNILPRGTEDFIGTATHHQYAYI
jgi:hypothetical protein